MVDKNLILYSSIIVFSKKHRDQAKNVTTNLGAKMNERITYFLFEIGSYFGGNTSIEYRNGKLCYKYSDYRIYLNGTEPVATEKILKQEDIQPLVDMLPEIINWKKYDYTEGIDDGIEWSMKIRCGRKQVNRAGYCTESQEFDKMILILEKMSGRKLFSN